MAQRYSRSGNSVEALTTPAADCRAILAVGGFTTGRIFWCKFIWVYNSSAVTDAVIQLFDQDEAVAVAANERFSFIAPKAAGTMIDIPGPGMKFVTNITAATTGGTVAIYQMGCGGYEEG